METPRKFIFIVSTKLNKYIVFTMQTYEKLITNSCKIFTKYLHIAAKIYKLFTNSCQKFTNYFQIAAENLQTIYKL